MIEPTKTTSSQSAPEQASQAAASRRTAAMSFQDWVTSGSSEETFGQANLWRSEKPAAPSAPVAAVPPVARQTADTTMTTTAPTISAASTTAAAAPTSPVPVVAPSSAPSIAAPSRTTAPEAKAAPPEAKATAPEVAVASLTNSCGDGTACLTPVTAGNSTANKGNVHAFAEGDEPTVWDLLDFVNPLQHIPVVNLIYRELTGDKIGALPQIVGGALLGGPVGALSAIVNVAVQETTGKDIGGQVMAMLSGEEEAPTTAKTKLADSATPNTSAPTATATDSGGSGATDAGNAAPPGDATAKPHGRIEVSTPPPSDHFVPYDSAPAAVLPEAQAAAQQAKATEETAAAAPKVSEAARPSPRTSGSRLKMPPRVTPTPPVTASALGRVSRDAVKPGAPSQAAHSGTLPPIGVPPLAGAESGGKADQEALATPGPTAPRHAISASDSVRPEANPSNTADFVGKFMSAMDKYDKASRLSPAAAAAAATTPKKAAN